VQPLAAGARIPVASLTTVDGEPIDLARAMGERGALLVFYRGGW
jgi:peroxiredoxin